ncbi:MAG TPA: hypothetical protein VF783_13770 [Terriglobales bacterium]
MSKAKMILDQIQTDSAEFAKTLDSAQREGFMVPHDGYMWRVTGQDSHDFSRTEHIGPLVNIAGGPRSIFIPGPTIWVFTLERDAE